MAIAVAVADRSEARPAAWWSSSATDPAKQAWGVTDGKGDPIILNFADYAGTYIYGRDFAASSQTAYNKTIGMGSTIDIRPLFERSNDRWFLVSVVHGEWTI